MNFLVDVKKEIERYCYRNLALNLLQTMENRRNTAEDIAKKVTFVNREKVEEILSQGPRNYIYFCPFW
jgi:hypothetical protein